MRNALLPILVLLTAAPAFAQAPDEPAEPVTAPAEPMTAPAEPTPFLASDPRELFRKGVELARRGSVEQAKAVFRSLTLAYPQLPEPYVNLAVLLAAQGDAEGAANTAEAAVLVHPVCRAAFRLELLPEIGAYSASLLGDKAGEGAVPAQGAAAPVPTREASAAVTAGEAETRAPAAGEAEVRAVTAMVRAWARAWSEQRVDDFLAFYAPGFRPPGGLDREAWEAQRRLRLAAPRFIEVSISDLAAELAAPGRGSATFTQRYSSDTYGDVVTKTLVLEKVGDAWKIAAERVDG